MPEEWVSLNEYMRRYKFGYEAVLHMIHEGKVEYQKNRSQIQNKGRW